MGEAAGKFLKYGSIFLISLYLVINIVMLSMGIWIIEDSYRFWPIITYSNALYIPTAIIAIVNGGIACILTAIGLYGAVMYSRRILKSFNIITTLMYIQEATILVLGFVFYTHSDLFLQNGAISTLLNDYGTSSSLTITDAWDYLQIEHKCCGYNNGSDYKSSIYTRLHTRANPWPPSCCTQSNGFDDYHSCVSSYDATASTASTGCWSVLRSLNTSYGPVLGLIGSTALGIHIITMIATSIYLHFG